MKKKLICGIISAILGVLTLAPNAAYAQTKKEDLNGDGIVSYEDYNLFVKSNGYNYGYDINNDYKVDEKDLALIKAAIVPTKIKGDLNSDGVISLEDKNLFSTVFSSTPFKLVEIDGLLCTSICEEDAKYGFDAYNMDLDNDGYVGPYDEVVFDSLYPLNSTNIKGDVNNDGSVDKKDLALLDSYVRTPYFSVDSSNSDLDNNGVVDFNDLSALKNLI